MRGSTTFAHTHHHRRQSSTSAAVDPSSSSGSTSYSGHHYPRKDQQSFWWQRDRHATAPPPRKSASAPRSADVKGKARARQDFFDIIALEEEALEQELAILDVQMSRESLATSSAAAGPSKQEATTSKSATPSTSQLSDRFDWRQTASSFRRLHLHDGEASGSVRNRRQASARLLRSLDSRSPELAARVEAYQHRLTYLVELEREFERAEWERLRSRGLDDLVAEGRAMSGVVGYWQGGDSAMKKKAKKPANAAAAAAAAKARTAVFTRQGMEKLGWTRLKEGDKVELQPDEETGLAVADLLPPEATVTTGKKKQDEGSAQRPPQLFATVLSLDPHRMRLLFHPPHSLVDLEACPSWRIDIAPNDAIDVKIDEAIENLAIDTKRLDMSDVQGRFELQGTELVESLVGQTEAMPSSSSIFESDHLIRSWYERYLHPNPLILDGDPSLGLNASQLQAVATMLSSRISLIQGPPGTGKTHTLVSTLKLLKHHFAVPHPILLSAHTNIAVDNLCDAALSAGLDVVRVGPATGRSSGGSRLEECTLEKKMEKHPLWKKLEEVKMLIMGVKRKLARLYDEEHARQVGGTTAGIGEAAPSSSSSSPSESAATLRKTLGRLAQQSFLLSRRIHISILYTADVVCSTLVSSTSSALRCIDFPVVFVDEATQAQEVMTLLPLMKGARHVGLIGDHRQLPPVLRCAEAKEQGGARSLFERLVDEDHEMHQGDEGTRRRARSRMAMLQVQHRMHPELAAFPNEQFYEGKLSSAGHTSEVAAVATKGIMPSSSIRLAFIDHPSPESISRYSAEVSLANQGEVELLAHVIYDVLASNKGTITGESIGVITPYLAQSRLISRTLLRPDDNANGEMGMGSSLRLALEKRLHEAGVSSPSAELAKIEVNTVDGFQGREKDVIIFSAVRSRGANTDPAIVPRVGFLADERRLNVALTRAKRACVVLGNWQTWRGSQTVLSGFAEHVMERGVVVEGEGVRERIGLGGGKASL